MYTYMCIYVLTYAYQHTLPHRHQRPHYNQGNEAQENLQEMLLNPEFVV